MRPVAVEFARTRENSDEAGIYTEKQAGLRGFSDFEHESFTFRLLREDQFTGRFPLPRGTLTRCGPIGAHFDFRSASFACGNNPTFGTFDNRLQASLGQPDPWRSPGDSRSMDKPPGHELPTFPESQFR